MRATTIAKTIVKRIIDCVPIINKKREREREREREKSRLLELVVDLSVILSVDLSVDLSVSWPVSSFLSLSVYTIERAADQPSSNVGAASQSTFALLLQRPFVYYHKQERELCLWTGLEGRR